MAGDRKLEMRTQLAVAITMVALVDLGCVANPQPVPLPGIGDQMAFLSAHFPHKSPLYLRLQGGRGYECV